MAFPLENVSPADPFGSAGEGFWSFTAIHTLLEGSEGLVWCQGNDKTERIHAGRHRPGSRQQKQVLDQLVARRALQGLHLLIVDDEPDGREVLRSVLQHCGAHVVTVASGPEAILAARAGLPDLLICDIYMPGMDGYTTLEHLHALAADHGSRLPAIALTAFARADDRIRALQSGFQRHLAKPVDYPELVRNILELVAGS